MQKLLLISTATILAFASYPVTGFCQALTEYSGITSHAATATAKAGSVLDKATQQLTGKINEKVSGTVQQPRPTTSKPRQAGISPPGSLKMLTIQSSRGTEVLCGPGETKAADSKADSQAKPCLSSSKRDSQANTTNSSSKTKTEASHPSVVTLSFPK